MDLEEETEFGPLFDCVYETRRVHLLDALLASPQMAASPPALFFASPDEEDEFVPPIDVDHDSDLVPASGSQTPSEYMATSSLFLAASDEDEADRVPTSSPPQLAYSSTDNVNDMEMQPISHVEMAASSAVGVPGATREEKLEEPPAKRRKLSPTVHSEAQFSSMYIGDLPVDGAWSTVSGTGYIKVGDSVLIRREGTNKESFGITVQSGNKTKKSGGGKQVSLTSMLKPQGTRSTKKVDTVVRIVNNKGFGIVIMRYYHPGFLT
jgi:DNA repair protein RAD5